MTAISLGWFEDYRPVVVVLQGSLQAYDSILVLDLGLGTKLTKD